MVNHSSRSRTPTSRRVRFLAATTLSACTGRPVSNMPIEEAAMFRFLRYKLLEKHIESTPRRSETSSTAIEHLQGWSRANEGLEKSAFKRCTMQSYSVSPPSTSLSVQHFQ
jgi:hypothetical protein